MFQIKQRNINISRTNVVSGSRW